MSTEDATSTPQPTTANPQDAPPTTAAPSAPIAGAPPPAHLGFHAAPIRPESGPRPPGICAGRDEGGVRYPPCRNYHRLVTDFDAMEPIDGSIQEDADGNALDLKETTHTCYPHPGIEMDIKVHIYECNRHSPDGQLVAISPNPATGRRARR